MMRLRFPSLGQRAPFLMLSPDLPIAVAFRRYEDVSLRYTGIESHEGLTHYGLYDTVVGRE